ncbi:unnamed protein product [Closterium sp. NIES-53]
MLLHDHTTLTPLPSPVLVALADPTSGPAVARSSMTLPCLAVPYDVLTCLHIPSFSRNLVVVTYLQDGHVGVCSGHYYVVASSTSPPARHTLPGCFSMCTRGAGEVGAGDSGARAVAGVAAARAAAAAAPVGTFAADFPTCEWFSDP